MYSSYSSIGVQQPPLDKRIDNRTRLMPSLLKKNISPHTQHNTYPPVPYTVFFFWCCHALSGLFLIATGASASSVNEERPLPWHRLPRLLPLLHAPPDADLLPRRGITFETTPPTGSFPLKGSRSLRSGSEGDGSGWSRGRGAGEHYCSSSSTTSKKTLESLSASVYDELQPFRSAHRNLIKVGGEPRFEASHCFKYISNMCILVYVYVVYLYKLPDLSNGEINLAFWVESCVAYCSHARLLLPKTQDDEQY